MKVAVSIPDAVFGEAEQLVRELRTTRSDLYARALAAFVDAHAPGRITERMNAALDGIDEPLDPAVRAASHRLLSRVEW